MDKVSSKMKFFGFSVIEFIVVIFVIAVIAFVSRPSFTKEQPNADSIRLLSLAKGSVASAVSMVQASVIAKASKPDTKPCLNTGVVADNDSVNSGQLCTENGLIYLTNAYPAVTEFGPNGEASANAGILAIAGLTSMFNPSKAALNAKGYDYSVNGTVMQKGMTTV